MAPGRPSSLCRDSVARQSAGCSWASPPRRNDLNFLDLASMMHGSIAALCQMHNLGWVHADVKSTNFMRKANGGVRAHWPVPAEGLQSHGIMGRLQACLG